MVFDKEMIEINVEKDRVEQKLRELAMKSADMIKVNEEIEKMGGPAF